MINTDASNSNNINAVSGHVIETNEPNEYSAKIELTAETAGSENQAKTPPLVADFTKSGSNNRIAFNLPNNDRIVYLNTDNKRYLILPNRKQFVEINKSSLGFQPPRLMMPGELIDYLKKQKNFEQVG